MVQAILPKMMYQKQAKPVIKRNAAPEVGGVRKEGIAKNMAMKGIEYKKDSDLSFTSEEKEAVRGE